MPSASNKSKHRYPAPPSTRGAMDHSTAKGLPIQAEEPEATTATSNQNVDAERQISSHHTRRISHANEVVDQPPAREARLPPHAAVSDPTSYVAPQTQLHHSMTRAVSLEAAGATSVAVPEEEPRCMFVDDCQTGSQLRKAISHLFGRNKACTLRIPKQVWVYYCRKHYQRIRYRNAKTYPLNQMHLVKLQINRLQRWSDDNQRQGTGPYIKLWTLTLRKREKNRLDKEGGAADEGEDEVAEQQIGSAAPDWIIQRLGTGYTTEQMLEVADRLHQEIEAGTLSQVPEVEFLPDITESENKATAKIVRSRKTARTATAGGEARTYKRKISEVMDAATPSLPNGHDADEPVGLSRKRARLSPSAANYLQPPPQMSLPPIAMPPYADARGHAPSAGFQSAIPRTLPAIPRMQTPFQSYSQGPDAYMHERPPGEYHRPGAFDGPYSRDPQQYPSDYHSTQSPWYQRHRDHYNHQRLPSISAHLSGASNYHGPYSPIPPYRGPETIGDGPNAPRGAHLRSYSTSMPAAHPNGEASRPATTSSSVARPGMTYFDHRAASSSAHGPSTRSYSRELWPEQDHPGYAPRWPQGSAPQQPHYYPSEPVYDQVPRPRVDSLRDAAAAHYSPAELRTAPERAEHEAHHYGNGWSRGDHAVAKVSREVRED